MLDKIHTDDSPMDMFTKVVTREKLNSSSTLVGLLDWIGIKEQQCPGWFDLVGTPCGNDIAIGLVSKWEIVV